MFQEQLIESRRQKVDGRRFVSVPVSIAVHAVVVGLAFVATLWAVDEIREPPIPVSFYAAAPAPAVPAGRRQGPKPPAAPKPREQAKEPEKVTVPVEIPSALPKPVEQEQPADTGGNGNGVEGIPEGWSTGTGPGLPFGDLRAEPEPEPEAATRIIRAGVDLQEPRRMVEVKPLYPEVARRAGLEGTVILEVTVNTDGGVRDVRVLRGMPLGMTEAAEDAVRRWRWEPARLDGRPVEVYITVTVIFHLK